MSKRIAWSLAALTLPALFAGGYAFSRRAPAIRGVPGDTIALAVTTMRECGTGDSSRACYERELTGLVESRGVKVAMGTLNRMSMKDAFIRLQGHVYSHAIGIAAGKGRSDVSAQFAECTEILQSGCYHGVIQGYFESASAVDSTSVNGLCRSYSMTGNQWLRFQCVHGLGHGLTMYYEHRLPDALVACDYLLEDWDRNSCYGGAFMENVMGATAPHHPATRLAADRGSAPSAGHAGGHRHGNAPDSPSARLPAWKALDSTDLQYPCSVMAEKYKRECYVMQTSVMLHFNRDVGQTARRCAEAPGIYRYVCHQSLGRDVSARAQRNLDIAIRLCSLADAEFQPWCHFGVVKDVIGIAARPQDGIEYCAEVPGERNKMLCYFAAGEQIAAITPSLERRRAECVTAEEAYRELCFHGAGMAANVPATFPRPRT